MRNSIILFFLGLLLTTTTTLASPLKCSEVFGNPSSPETWEQLYRSSDLSPRPQLWLRIRQGLQKSVTNVSHPLQSVGQNADKIGQVIKDMATEFPTLRDLIDLSNRMDKGFVLSHADFLKIKHMAANPIIQVSRNPKSHMQTFGALEALKVLSFIEARVEFPKTKEQIEEEKKEKQKEKKKKEKKKEEEEEEEEPKWNKVKDKYKPENKDLGQQGKKQKNVDVVLTDVNLKENKLLRQGIFEEFSSNSKEWSSLPAVRQPIQHESTFTKKLILHPLGETSVRAPIPYGYTLIPGKYSDHTISELGAGEFDVLFKDNKPVTLGLAKIQRESHLPTLPTQVSAEELAHWPSHLLLFAQSLKGKSSLQAAAELKKYISEDGGFLYYSTGDEIDKEHLSQIDKDYQDFQQRMPKPMAMATVKAFNCDGAAWIGALLLRDVLKIPVRIAAGRTAQGKKPVNGEELWVSKSSSPGHAWVEVYENGVWVPFDMTPTKNAPKSDSAPTDLEQDREDKDNKPSDDNKDDKEDQKSDSKDSKDKDKDKDGKEDKDEKEKEGEKGKEKKDGEKNKVSEPEDEATNRKIEDLLDAKSSSREQGEANLSLVERLLKRNELMLVERLIKEGYQTAYLKESNSLLEGIMAHPRWKNMAVRSAQRLQLIIDDAKFVKFPGIQQFLNNIRDDFSQNRPREGKQKLMGLQKYMLALSEYRKLRKEESDVLIAIEQLIAAIDVIKHKNSKEFDAVDAVIKSLPGNISKNWLEKTYGKDYAELGSDANIRVAKDFVENNKLQPLLQMAALSGFVDMTLSATTEPTFKDEVTLNRSLVPKPERDLVITRSPLDFRSFLWGNGRPGEHRFAATVQGRQFAVLSLETERVINPKRPIEKKVSVVYYDISPSMDGQKIKAQDSLMMAYVDRALSEVDDIGRNIHEIYLVPFHTDLEPSVHIATREDAIAFLAHRMNMTTKTTGGTDIQKTLENFYDIISASYKEKAAKGHGKLFQRANMVLFTDGGSAIDMAALEKKRKTIPKEVNINMNFVAIGESENETLKDLAKANSLSSTKPAYRELIGQKLTDVANAKLDYDPQAFATTQNVPGRLLAQINELIKKMRIEPVMQPDQKIIDKSISQISITKDDVRTLTGLREALNLTQLEEALSKLALNTTTKQRLLQGLVEAYPDLISRKWNNFTYQEKDAFEKLRAWSLK